MEMDSTSNLQMSSIAGKKRPNDGSGQRVPKRRASQACQTCRGRKVRCDIMVHGIPCTNCRLDKSECTVIASRRGPKKRVQLQPEAEDESQHDISVDSRPSDAGAIVQQERGDDIRLLDAITGSHMEDSLESQPANTAALQYDDDIRSSEGQTTQQQQLHHTMPSKSHRRQKGVHEVAVGLLFDGEDNTAPVSTAGSDIMSPAQTRIMGSTGLPGFIHPLPTSLTEDDLEYLAKKGAFVIPDPVLRMEILRCYVSEIHPFMPILDLKHFVDAILSDGKTGRVGLHVFQAVMFAGLASLSPEILRAHSFENAKSARRIFFERVRLLHDLVDDPDSRSLLQTLILMSLWYGGRTDQKNTWYYLGLAWSLAQSMGLHREPDPALPDVRLRRRLWWSLYIRDRLISLETRRPMSIRDEEYEVSVLALSDFTNQDQGVEVHAHGHSQPDSELDMRLPLMCIELTKLCVLVGHVLTDHYTTLGRRNLWTRGLNIVPRDDLDEPTLTSKLAKHDNEIADWDRALHPDLREISMLRAEESRSPGDSVQRHWMIIDMIRLTLIGLLYRPQSLRPLPSTASHKNRSAELIRTSRNKLKAAARSLTKNAHAMYAAGEARFLTTIGIPCLLSASLTHLLDVDSADEDVRDASIFRLYQIMQVFQSLREIYASADSEVAFLGRVIQKTRTNVRLPQIAAMAPEFKVVPAREGSNAATTEAGRRGHNWPSSMSALPPTRTGPDHTVRRDQVPPMSTSGQKPSRVWEDDYRTPAATSGVSRGIPVGLQTPNEYNNDAFAYAGTTNGSLPHGMFDSNMDGHNEDLLTFFGAGLEFEPLRNLDYNLDAFDYL